MSIIIFIISLAILILVHEFGHFIAAKKSGIRVDEFGLGFPPKIISKRKGETLYTLNAIPFGGFVRIFGEDPHVEEISEADKPRSMFYQPAYVKAMVLVAGVGFNIIFAWLLISLGFIIGLPSPVQHSGFGEVRDAHVAVVEVLPGSPAEKAGLQPGDTVISLSSLGTTISGSAVSPSGVSDFIGHSTGGISFTYQRGSAPATTTSIIPNASVVPGRRAIGIAMDDIGTLKLPVHLALLEGAHSTGLLLKNTVVGLAGFVGNIFSRHSDFSQVSGPVGIARVFSQADSLGFVYILSLVALISINLAVINLVPFPALDGGRLLFVLIEAVIRRPIPMKVVRWTNAIGFALLLILMGVITVHDILKLL
jgi:regulator of sigma E protease